MVIRLVSTVCAASLLTGLLAASPIAPDRASRGTSSGGPTIGNGTPKTLSPVPGVEDAGIKASPSPDAGLKPRVPFAKVPSKLIELPVHQATGKPTWNGRLIVKFRDDLKMRADAVPGMFVRNRLGEPIPEVSEILSALDGTVRSALRQSPEALRGLEQRAESLSGRAQPDLGGLVYVDVRPEQLLAAARAFNDLEIVEYVEIETTPEQHRQNFSSQFGCGAAGENSPLTAGINNCYTASRPPQVNAPRCSALGGGGGCNAPQICEADIVLPECRAGCNDTQCCTLISGCLPGCSEVEGNQGWDALCATYANVLCAQFGSIYDGGPPRGTPDGTPDNYKYDPCFAMRGAIFSSPATEGGPVVVQGQVVAPDTPNTVSGGLMEYTLDPNTGQFVPGTDRLDAINYPNLNITDEADPNTGVPQQAMPDPSLEGGGSLLAGGCFTPHASGGCSQVTCCVYVCRNDPACCIIEWDDNCVSLATSAPAPEPGSEGELLGLGSPCTGDALPAVAGVAPDTNFPPSGPTPLLTAGREVFPSGQLGSARGYQAYTVGEAMLDPFTAPTALVPPQVYPVEPPTQPNTVVPDPTRSNRAGNLGTLAFLNSGYRGGGLDLAGYDALLGDLGIDAATQGRGQNTTVAVIDLSAFVEHEDLVNVVNPEPGQTQVLIDQDPMDPDHGTAVLGVIGAEDNDFGVTGIASGATINFYPSVSVEEGERLIAAITQALIDLGEGDVICMPIGSNGNAIVSQPTVNLLVGVGTGAGIATVCSAGNAGVGINQGPADSGAIITSACWPGYRIGTAPGFSAVPGGNGQGGLPGFNYCRFQQSNYEPDEGLPGVQASSISAWGTGVATCGYGDLFQGDSPSTDPLQVNKLRTYTAGQSFEGTSAAAAIIAGWCSRLQSFSLAYFGTALPVPDLRDAMETPGNYFQQCGLAYSAQGFPGFPENCEQYGDVVAGGQQARIGGFPRTRNTVAWLVANAFSGANPVIFDIITGTYQAGGAFSLREVDDITLRIAAQRRRAGNKGQGFGSSLFYPLTGGTTDLQLSVTASSPPSQITAFVLQTRSRVSWNLPVIQIVYFYNFVQRRWEPSGYLALSAAYSGGTYAPFGDPRDFMRPSQGGSGTQIYARVYTCGLTGAGYTVLHDQLNFVIDVDIFDTGGGAGLP